jgi:3-oxoacyl-[acyl-carrier-protein] synthase-3
LNTATQIIRSGAAENILVIGAETLSRLVNWHDRQTCILFGDGAGAFVLQASDEPGGVISSVMRSDGSGGDLLSVPAGGSRFPASAATVYDGMHLIHMNGREVFRFATRVMAQATREAVDAAHLNIDDINLIIPHQANYRIIEAAIRGLEFPIERCVINLDRYGNTSTASIPIATCEAVQSGRLKTGNQIVFVGFGAGLTWGASVVTWSGPFSEFKKRKPVQYQRRARLRSAFRRLFRHIEGMIWGSE